MLLVKGSPNIMIDAVDSSRRGWISAGKSRRREINRNSIARKRRKRKEKQKPEDAVNNSRRRLPMGLSRAQRWPCARACTSAVDSSTLQIPNNFAKGQGRAFFRCPGPGRRGESARRDPDMNKCKNRTNLFRAAANLRGGTAACALPRTSLAITLKVPRVYVSINFE